MMVFDRLAIVLGAVVDDATDGAENIAWGLPQHLFLRPAERRAEVIRCQGAVKSGAQCKRRPVPGSAYCYQHRNQAKLDRRLAAVMEARAKAARMTSALLLLISAATVSVRSRLAALRPRLCAHSLTVERISEVRQAARPMMESLQIQRRWVTSAIMLGIAAAVPIAFLTLANGDLDSLARFAREIIPGNLPAIARSRNIFGSQQLNAEGFFTQDKTRAPGTNFASAYVSMVGHISADSSMLQIIVPAGVEGTYHAVVTASEGVEYQCIILQPYTDRLHCIGLPLPEASLLNLRIFRIDEVDGSQILVFETNYTTGEIAPLATPSPTFTLTPTQTPTFTHAPIRSLVLTADDADSGSGDNHSPPSPPAASETPQPTSPAATDTPPGTINEHSCNSKLDHPRYCTPSPDS